MPPTQGYPWDDLRKNLYEGQRMAKVHSGEEISPKGSTEYGARTLRTDRRQTGGFAIANTGTSRSHVRVNMRSVRYI